MSNTPTPDICPKCGGRVSVTTAVRIVTLETKPEDTRTWAIPVSFALPQCLNCGRVYATPEQVDALNERAKALATHT